MNNHSKSQKKALGAYYTPNNLSKVLCDWAIRMPNDHILEPSFGGCGFLEASVERLTDLGSIHPKSQLYGVDIDATAFNFLKENFADLSNFKRHFLYKDFIQTKSHDFKHVGFDVVLGNPPYVSMHNMSKTQKESCFKLLKESEFADDTLGRNASLWSFFLLHSLSFIKSGGRSVWVLPSSLLHADYANAILKIYCRHFSTVKIVKLGERFFQGDDADEISVILFADNFSQEKKESAIIGYSSVYGSKELELLCKDIKLNSIKQVSYKSTIISEKTINEFNLIKSSSMCVPLGELSKIVIGMVTGDNKTFIIDKKTAEKNSLKNEDLRPVIGRFSSLSGLIHTKTRHLKIQEENHKSYLVCPTSILEKHSTIRNYLSKVSKKNRINNRTFSKRPNWYYPDDNRYPDAFLTYMIHKTPRLVINLSKITCTNSIHRVFFRKDISSIEQKAIAMSMLSSFSQLSAEMEGRAYGSGVLKLEPSAAKKIQVLLTPKLILALNEHYKSIDNLLINGSVVDAQSIVDKVIVDSLEIDSRIMKLFSTAVEKLRQERYLGLNRT
ncbi:N-6 DNA methylase [Pantoea sp. SM3]|uniref:N-6 DNA methylase n=1 Tax=Pantoea sp. SM3 TaxID=1628192 RepID=UPI0005F7F4C1|nr:N-6 DNA methylase [Pantoea sp. SM3]KJV27311.1 hypothetical protein VI01_19670 [Pantoea sp. SM3]